jgi:hypothetical protein
MKEVQKHMQHYALRYTLAEKAHRKGNDVFNVFTSF